MVKEGCDLIDVLAGAPQQRWVRAAQRHEQGELRGWRNDAVDGGLEQTMVTEAESAGWVGVSYFEG